MGPIADWTRFGRDVAAELGGLWRASPHHWDEAVVVEHPDGHRIMLEPDRTGERIYAHGELPNGADNVRGIRHEISVRADRGPAALAADITRRLLPGYCKDLAAAQKFLREKEQTARARARKVRQLTGALTGDVRTPAHLKCDQWTTISWYTPGAAVREHRIAVLGDGSRAELTLAALPFPLVKEICELLARHERAAAKPSSGAGRTGGRAA
ncbi:hypothetical protein [Actinomadura violacea]|uniref:Uncharacterized protein n=1 Tax=Actinomadura violacea TaxID=2819934 RepID=A0ABS3S9V1_9ACTN|nr:hypothetical protein [Actinomadura violacea]MBO2464995.1 hypothetical protein [Actinomadura violacea]